MRSGDPPAPIWPVRVPRARQAGVNKRPSDVKAASRTEHRGRSQSVLNLVTTTLRLPKRLLVGNPMTTTQLQETLLPKRLALPVYCSDPISSNAYATQEILLVLALGERPPCCSPRGWRSPWCRCWPWSR